METGKEQIEKAAEKWAESTSDGLYYDKGPLKRCRKAGFVAGAKWTYETMVERACNWMETYFSTHKHYPGDRLDFIEEFRKAMGERS